MALASEFAFGTVDESTIIFGACASFCAIALVSDPANQTIAKAKMPPTILIEKVCFIAFILNPIAKVICTANLQTLAGSADKKS
jgi:hypothetical protein